MSNLRWLVVVTALVACGGEDEGTSTTGPGGGGSGAQGGTGGSGGVGGTGAGGSGGGPTCSAKEVRWIGNVDGIATDVSLTVQSESYNGFAGTLDQTLSDGAEMHLT
ncbi:MAG: hypothetical protein RIF41_11070, partial [Polyangiaceae bacterium]